IVKKGQILRRLTKGLVPFLVVIGVLDVLAALEPDLSIAMLYTLLMALLLFVGGARMGHFIALGAMFLPITLTKIEKWRYAVSRQSQSPLRCTHCSDSASLAKRGRRSCNWSPWVSPSRRC